MVLKCLQPHGACSVGQHNGKCCDQSMSNDFAVHRCARQVLLADANCRL